MRFPWQKETEMTDDAPTEIRQPEPTDGSVTGWRPSPHPRHSVADDLPPDWQEAPTEVNVGSAPRDTTAAHDPGSPEDYAAPGPDDLQALRDRGEAVDITVGRDALATMRVDGAAGPLPDAPGQDESQPLLPAAYAREGADSCEHCYGTGRKLNTNDLLRLSLSYLPTDNPDATDALILHFYGRVATAAPHLVPLFPADLIDPLSPLDSGGRLQRDALLGALVAVSQSYDPDHPDSEGMQILGTHLAQFGRAHFAFARPDGTTRGATVQEYGAVIALTIETLKHFLGAYWTADFERVWNDALDYASRKMLRAHDEWLDSHPNPVGRRPRPTKSVDLHA